VPAEPAARERAVARNGDQFTRDLRVVCVTGMHRSGTSLTTRVINLLGVDLGAEEKLMSPGRGNPRGYWENRQIRRWGDGLLEALGGNWRSPPALRDGWELGRNLDGFRDRARRILAKHFPDRGYIGWKDPRTSLLLPMWRTVVPIYRTILVLRDPRHVAGSLAERSGIDPEYSAYLWLRYTVSAWRSDPACLLVRYDDFLQQPHRLPEEIAAFLGLPDAAAACRAAIATFIDARLRHDVGVDSTGPNLSLARELFTRLEHCRTESAAALIADLHAGWLSEAATPPTPLRARGAG
jgi:hypothetical protein